MKYIEHVAEVVSTFAIGLLICMATAALLGLIWLAVTHTPVALKIVLGFFGVLALGSMFRLFTE